jgi:anti-anti-sigma factor
VSLDARVANVEHDLLERHSGPLTITVSWRKDTAIMVLAGEVDLAAAPLLHACLKDVAGVARGDLVVDLDLVIFLDASGLSFLVTAQQLFATKGCRMMIMSPPRPVRRLFEVTGLNPYLTIVSRYRPATHERLFT